MSGPLYRIDQEDDRLVMWEFRSGSTIVIVIMSVMVDADKNKRKKYECCCLLVGRWSECAQGVACEIWREIWTRFKTSKRGNYLAGDIKIFGAKERYWRDRKILAGDGRRT